mmetsp:Transcript_42413/g.47906  ORF Transcript_42413/g.47906 Transcript_42413/m.47906 type:complete len:96 (-) Transcript_42413:502-789(-)
MVAVLLLSLATVPSSLCLLDWAFVVALGLVTYLDVATFDHSVLMESIMMHQLMMIMMTRIILSSTCLLNRVKVNISQLIVPPSLAASLYCHVKLD